LIGIGHGVYSGWWCVMDIMGAGGCVQGLRCSEMNKHSSTLLGLFLVYAALSAWIKASA
jgi:hypothetical protein